MLRVVTCVHAYVCLALYDPMDCGLPGALCPWEPLGENSGVGCHALLQREEVLPEIFGVPLEGDRDVGALCGSHQG